MFQFFTKIVCLTFIPGVLSLEACSGNSTSSCCLCSIETDCEQICPQHLWRVTDTRYSLDCQTTTVDNTSLSSSTTTTMTMTTEDAFNQTGMPREITTTTEPPRNVTVCLEDCPDGFYPLDETEKICEACHSACLTCNGSLVENCTQCRYRYDDWCVSVCPEGTEVSGNATDCMARKVEEKFPLAAVIGGAAGGGVVLIVIVVVIVCLWCRLRARKGTSERTRMSVINEERSLEEVVSKTDDETVQPSTATKRRTPPRYENTGPVLDNMGEQVQRQGDKIFRYVPDPTLKPEKAKEKDSDPRSSGYYENESAVKGHFLIQRNRNSEQREIEALPVAPKPPQGSGSTPSDSKQRKPIPEAPAVVKKVIQSKSKKAALQRQAEISSEGGEDYMAMGQPEEDTDQIYENQEQPGEEIYENQGFTDEDGPLVATEENSAFADLEDYENVLKVQSTYENFNFKRQ